MDRAIATGRNRRAMRVALPGTMRSGLERGEVGWKDPVASPPRHRCNCEQFFLLFQLIRCIDERGMPAVSPRM
jgi:hypothetical protein